MPTYAYRCRSCGHHFERHQSFTDLALRVCPKCHKWTLRRVIPLVRIAFKGSGFYSTDNKASASKKPKKKRAPADKAQPAKTAPGSKKTD